MKNNSKKTDKTAPVTKPANGKTGMRLPILPVMPILFVLTYLWAAWYYADVLRMARERSFWVLNPEQMAFLLDKEFGGLWYVGRMLLSLFRYPWIGAVLLSAFITFGTWCTGYAMRLRGNLRFLQYIPAGIFFGWMAYEGLNLFFENETGMILGIPFCVVLILTIWSVMIASFSRKKAPALFTRPKDETWLENWLQIGMLVLIFGGQAMFIKLERPYTRVIAAQDVCLLNSDWQGIIKVSRKNASLSHRPIAAKYAIALVETEQICDRMYDIRLDYDSLYLHSQSGEHSMSLNLYQEDCDFYAGFIETCIHHAMERVTMIGPNIHSLELLTKCSILRSEWEVAEKYLRILRDVPFEGGFVDKYSAYINDSARIVNDPEFAMIRKLEPVHDSFENNYQQPVFMGYNLSLTEGRSQNALFNSLACCIYTKVMPAFMLRTEPLHGTTPPENVADALCLMTTKDPGITQRFTNLEYRMNRLHTEIGIMKPFMSDRPGNARQLFDRYRGYYPYYYFFGNLKATKKKETKASSNAGVN